MIYAPSGKPIKYIKGVPTEHGFEEVPDEEIVKGYEHAKGQRGLLLTILRYGTEGHGQPEFWGSDIGANAAGLSGRARHLCPAQRKLHPGLDLRRFGAFAYTDPRLASARS
jgi:hypothetical protein